MPTTNTSRVPSWLPPAGTFAVVFFVGLLVHVQGFNLLDDGLWVLGARVVADGDLLYRDLFSIYGPARYLFLLPFFLACGKSVLGLAVAKATGDGLAAVVGLWGARRLGAGRWAWSVPLGVIALAPIQPRYVAAMALAVLAADTLLRGLDKRRGIGLGLLWGVLSLFGLDMTGYGGVILGMTFLADRRWSPPEGGGLAGRAWLNVLLGWAGVLAVAAVVALVLGVAGDAVWDTAVYPITRFRGGMGLSWWNEFGDSTKLGETFATLYTGETLGQVWPGQIWQRILGLRVLYGLIWIVPPLGTWLIVHGRKAAWAPVAGLAFAGWATLVGRGDVSHLTLAWCGSLLLIPLILKEFRARSLALVVTAALVVLGAWWPTGMENIWLATHFARSTLVSWDRPTARIRQDAKRIGDLEELLGFVPTDPKIPQLTWPVQPGLTFLQGSALATAQATLLAGEVRDPQKVIADLERTRPPAIIQGRSGGLVPGVRTFRGLAPGIYPYVRNHYAAVGTFTLDRETYQILARQDDGPRVIPDMELKYQLPGAEQLVQEAYTPLVTGGVRIVQTLRIYENDFRGLVLRLTAPGPYPRTVPVQLTILEALPSGKFAARASWVYPVVLESQEQNKEFRFDPLPGTVGKAMAFAVSAPDSGAVPFRLVWDRPADREAHATDFFPDGEVLVDGRPAGADLYFMAY